MKRIASLDMLRGYALVCIMLDHMPISVLRNVTLSNFVVFDAAELFVLLSGFLVGLVWIKVEEREGLEAAQKRFWRRAFQVWRALILGSIALAVLSKLLFMNGLHHTAVWSEYSNMITERPVSYIVTVALMWMQPNLMDVLALYVLLIATVPITVPLMIRHPFIFAICSALLWWFAKELNTFIPNQRPGPGLLFNPFGWQILFFAGVAMGAFRKQIMARLLPWCGWVTSVSIGIMAFGCAILIAWRLGPVAKPVRDALFLIHGEIDKWSMDGMRLLSVLAASWLVAVPLANLFGRIADTNGGRALAEIGRGGLWAFVACVLLSIFGDALDMTAPKGVAGWVIRVAIDLWVIVALYAMSAVWLQRRTLLPQLYRN